MKKNKRLLFKTVLLLSVFVLGFALFSFMQKLLPLQNTNMQSVTQSARAMVTSNNGQTKSSTTADEQEQINAHILANWGTPVADKVVALHGVYNDKNIPFQYLSGEYWYYLTGDVFLNLKKPIPFSNATKINLLLNGYAIDGNVNFVFNSTESTFKIYDTLPNQNSAYGTRNSITKHYYYYNTNTGNYDNYSTSILAGGRDETNLPTFTKDSYITVEGSRIGANSLSATYAAALGRNNTCYIKVSGDLHLFGLNIVGKQNTYSGSTKNGLIYTDTKQTSSIEMIQCNILGNNLVKSGYSGAVNIFSQGANRSIDSKIYGNKVNKNSVGVEVGQCKYNDVVLSYSGVPGMLKTLYAGNIGALTGGHAKGAIYFVLGVDFGNQLIEQNITIKNFHTILQNLSNLSGTIELVNNIQLEYNGKSPNLQFTIREKEIYIDAETEKNVNAVKTSTQTNNELTINADAQIKAIDMSGGKVVVRNRATVEAINCLQGKLTIEDGANVNWNKVYRKNQISQSLLNKLVVIIIAVGVLIAVIFTINFIIIRKKKKQKRIYNTKK